MNIISTRILLSEFKLDNAIRGKSMKYIVRKTLSYFVLKQNTGDVLRQL